MKPITSAEIRNAFLEYYEELNHQVVSSSPLPAYDNPTLLFTNAGMNQFVNVFLGKEKRSYNRATTAQKCMRVQGKHNDLENVGPSDWHHTFFEMLGNFSFGDYFKEGAIRFAYTFLTEVCQIPPEKLWYTVHVSDDDAYNIWVNKVGVDPERVLRMGDKTNFWMMGDVGPCGPTSEIHYDWGPEHCTCGEENCSVLLDNDCGRWLEVWNLVFMQYNQDEDGTRTPLPNPGVDTGMGLERLTTIQQQVPVTYYTDLFTPAMNRVQELLGHSDEQRQDRKVETAYRVIADHGRAATFMIGDGVLPGNEGRSYVLRMIIRRAARFGRKIGFTEPFLAEIARVFIEKMGDVYPELVRNQELIFRTVTAEENRFIKVLDGSLAQLDEIMNELKEAGEKVIPGETVFNLYATHGLPLEITRDEAKDRGFEIDEAGYKEARAAHSQASGAGSIGEYDQEQNVYARLLNELIEQGLLPQSGIDYDPYSGPQMESEVLAIIKDGQSTGVAEMGEKVEIVTAGTPFYVEAGGEVSDTGWIRIAATDGVVRVEDTQRPDNGPVIHVGKVIQGSVSVGQLAALEVDDRRRWDIRRNHTATHILHRELRAALGTHVTQQGSLVAPDRLRFDFSHETAVDDETLSKIESAINEAILENQPVTITHMPQKKAIEAGAMALFGEKYGEIVRTIRIGVNDTPYSFELCGGLHVHETGDIGPFFFTSEEAVGAGVRRVEAVTGHGAQAYAQERLARLERLGRQLNTPVAELEGRVSSLLDENKALQKEIAALRRGQARSQFESLMTDLETFEDFSLMRAVVEGVDMDGLREMADWFRDRVKSGVAVLSAVSDNKPLLIVAVTEDLTKRGLKAGDIVREVAKIVGGGGGGRPTLAQAGGKNPEKLPEAMDAVPGLVERFLTT
ncbi:MAG: alanine--tRNA ligase [Candidatus Promineifilaceae bacterium]